MRLLDILIFVMGRDKLLPTKQSGAKLVSWKSIMSRGVPFSKKSRAGIVVDRKGAPLLFIFDTLAFLDVLSEIDEELVDRLSSKDYHSKDANLAGWIIDEIETKLPLRKEYSASLKEAIAEAREKGWVPFEKIDQDVLH